MLVNEHLWLLFGLRHSSHHIFNPVWWQSTVTHYRNRMMYAPTLKWDTLC